MSKDVIRMCQVCKQRKVKSDLLRVVKTNEDEFIISNNKNVLGRSAYICNNDECIKKAIKTKVLNKSFKQNINNVVYEKLMENLSGK